MKKLAVAACLAVIPQLVSAQSAARADHPNFSGNWIGDDARSTSRAGTVEITHQEPTMKVHLTFPTGNGDVMDQTLIFTSDGKPAANTIARGPGAQAIHLESVGKWIGDTLYVESSAQLGTQMSLNKERWYLHGADLVHTMSLSIEGADQGSQKIIYKRKSRSDH